MSVDMDQLLKAVRNCSWAFNLSSNPFTWDPAEFEILTAEILKNPNITTLRFRNLDISAAEEKSQARQQIQEKVKRITHKFGLRMLEVHIPFTADNLHLLRSMVLVSECTFLVIGQLKAGNVPLSIEARHIELLSGMLQSASRINPNGGPKTVGFVGTFSTDGYNQLCLEIPKFTQSLKGLSLRSTLQTRHKYLKLFKALQNCDLESIRLMFNKLTYKHGVNFAECLSSGLGRHLRSIDINVSIANDKHSTASLVEAPSLRGFGAIFEGLATACPNLVHLAITPFSQEVCKGLPALKALKHLDLSGCHEREISCELLASCLPKIYQLEVLELKLPTLDKRKEDYEDLRDCVKQLKSLHNLIFDASDYDGCCAILDGLVSLTSIRRLRFSFGYTQTYRYNIKTYRYNIKDISISLYRLLKSSGVTELQCPLSTVAAAYPPLKDFLEKEARLTSVMDMLWDNNVVEFNKNVATRCSNYLIATLRSCFPQIPLAVAKVLALYVGSVIFNPFYDLDYFIG